MTRGGKRPGAGRPAQVVILKDRLNMRIKPEMKTWLTEMAKKCDLTVTSLVECAIEKLREDLDAEPLP